MSVAMVTGSAGLVGAETVRLLHGHGLEIVGIDNDMRGSFFGPDASTARSRRSLERELSAYTHIDVDIRDRAALEPLFKRYGAAIVLVIHTAAQPSHDWAARAPETDFAINASATLTLLELTRTYCDQAVFILTSTNKVYGDEPNRLPLIELEHRWELPDSHRYGTHGIDESMSIDQSLHSLFGVSKLSADLLVQEYGRYFGLKTACFRCGCLTGPHHAGAPLHGFLAYLVKCTVNRDRYEVLGYGGKQVRDNLHARDLAQAFWHFFNEPRSAEVYNMGGGRQANCSMLEAIEMTERVVGRPLNWSYSEQNRIGDHIWWISDVRKFQSHYPGWRVTVGIEQVIEEIGDRLAGHEVAQVE
jgi:CDP-paratose 2-epimerase